MALNHNQFGPARKPDLMMVTERRNKLTSDLQDNSLQKTPDQELWKKRKLNSNNADVEQELKSRNLL
jgi:hypothetical protein